MSWLKHVLAAIAAAELAYAQGSCSGPTTVQNQGDASALGGCQTYSGDVTLATGAPAMVDFSGQLTEIDGDFSAVNTDNVNQLSFGSLETITGRFHLQNMSQLYNLNVPQLSNVNELSWTALALNGLNFGDGLQKVNTLTIADTFINKLDSINLKSAQSIDIANNRNLQSINWQLSNVSQGLTLNSNGGSSGSGLNAKFPNLANAGYLEISNVSALMVPSLNNVSSTVSVYGSSLSSLMMPNLTRSKGLYIKNNKQLNRISFPMFRDCEGGLGVSSNDNLGGTISFPALQTIRGALNITGSFTGLDIPKLNTVQGASVVQSSSDLGNTCDTFGKGGSYASNVIQGKATCEGKSNNPNSNSQGGSGTSSGSSSSSSGAASYIGPAPGSAFGLMGLLAAMLGMF